MTPKNNPQYFMIYDLPGGGWRHVVTSNPDIYKRNFKITYCVNLDKEEVYAGYKHLLNMHKEKK